jgi:hypothetical protein
MFEALENTAVAIWVGESIWGYPLLLGTHVVGLAVVAGIFLMLDLRILGFNKGVSYESFLSLFRLAWTGLAINAVSGTALFSSQATTFISSTPFLLKIGSITIGVICAVIIRGKLRENAASWDTSAGGTNGATRLVAVVSLLCWIGAIGAGRLIAYL